MSLDDLHDSLSFLQKDESEPVCLRPETPGGATSVGTWLIRGTVLAATAAIFVTFLHFKGIVAVPGLTTSDAAGPRATAPSQRGPSLALLPEPVPPQAAKSIPRQPRNVDVEETEPPKRAEPAPKVAIAPGPAGEKDVLPNAPTHAARAAPADTTKDNQVAPAASHQDAVAVRSPLDVLKSYGLTQSGAYFLLASESEVFQALKVMQPVLIRMAEAGDALMANAEVEATFQEFDDARIGLEEQLKHILVAIPQMPRRTIEQKAELQEAMRLQYQTRQSLIAVNANLEAVGKRRLSPPQLAKLQDQFQARRKDFLQAASELRPIVDKVRKQYNDLKNDSPVSQALNEFGQANHFKAQLGPSPSFQKGVGTVITAERTYSPETASARVRPKRKTKR